MPIDYNKLIDTFERDLSAMHRLLWPIPDSEQKDLLRAGCIDGLVLNLQREFPWFFSIEGVRILRDRGFLPDKIHGVKDLIRLKVIPEQLGQYDQRITPCCLMHLLRRRIPSDATKGFPDWFDGSDISQCAEDGVPGDYITQINRRFYISAYTLLYKNNVPPVLINAVGEWATAGELVYIFKNRINISSISEYADTFRLVARRVLQRAAIPPYFANAYIRNNATLGLNTILRRWRKVSGDKNCRGRPAFCLDVDEKWHPPLFQGIPAFIYSPSPYVPEKPKVIPRLKELLHKQWFRNRLREKSND